MSVILVIKYHFNKKKISPCCSTNKKGGGEIEATVPSLLKSTCKQLLDIYVKHFNIIFKYDLIPESWILRTIKPFYKNKGNKYDPKQLQADYYSELFWKIVHIQFV